MVIIFLNDQIKDFLLNKIPEQKFINKKISEQIMEQGIKSILS